MSSEHPGSSSTDESKATTGRGRGRGEGAGGAPPRRGRGGFGKYLRAQGRGRRRGGRPAVFQQRLLLEGEEKEEVGPDSEEAKEQARKYGKRQLLSNADRFAEAEPTLNSDGELEEEPEVDLTKFLARQRLDIDEVARPLSKEGDEDDEDDEDEIDMSLAHLTPKPPGTFKKGKMQEIEWNDDLERMRLEKETADAHRDMKERFRANVDRQKHRQPRVSQSTRTKDRAKETVIEASPLPTETSQFKTEKEEMEGFLDDLLG